MKLSCTDHGKAIPRNRELAKVGAAGPVDLAAAVVLWLSHPWEGTDQRDFWFRDMSELRSY